MASPFFIILFMARIIMKMMKAGMRKLMAMVMKSPQAKTGPSFFASASAVPTGSIAWGSSHCRVTLPCG